MSDDRLRVPLLSQLVDDDPASSQEAPPSHQQIYRTVVDGLKRDLLDLLNTRERCRSWPSQLSELRKSVFAYGIPDVSGAHLATESDRNAFLNSLGPLIRRCDERFKSVSIVANESADSADRVLRFRIEAVVRVETGAESLAFDFKLEPVTRTFE
ncbi:MAG: type VI secretion system protein ImpF [Planctomycetota bacterium]|jgi:type VI secretion system protein ImpF